MAKFIAEAHGGHVRIESKGSDLGSTIVFEIPLSSGDSEKQNDTLVHRSQQEMTTTIATTSHPPSRSHFNISDNDRELVNKDLTNKSGGGSRQILGHFGDKMILPSIQEQEKEEKKALLANVSSKEPDDSLRFGNNQHVDSDKTGKFTESQRSDVSVQSSAVFAGYHVLVVEDSAAARKVLYMKLILIRPHFDVSPIH